MNRIGKINHNIDNILKLEDIESVKTKQLQFLQNDKKYSPIDLFRYPSLRMLPIWDGIANFMILVLYYGPVFILSSFGFNPFVVQIIFCSSEIVAYWLSSFMITTISRLKAGMILLSLTLVCNFAVVFIEKP